MRHSFPVIDPVATGANIARLRRERGLTVRDLQAFFGFEEPQAIYKWQRGQSLPSVDNLYALGSILETPLEDILVASGSQLKMIAGEPQAQACGSAIVWNRLFGIRRRRSALTILGVGAGAAPWGRGPVPGPNSITSYFPDMKACAGREMRGGEGELAN